MKTAIAALAIAAGALLPASSWAQLPTSQVILENESIRVTLLTFAPGGATGRHPRSDRALPNRGTTATTRATDVTQLGSPWVTEDAQGSLRGANLRTIWLNRGRSGSIPAQRGLLPHQTNQGCPGS